MQHPIDAMLQFDANANVDARVNGLLENPFFALTQITNKNAKKHIMWMDELYF